MSDRYWKVLGEDRIAWHGGSGQWYPQAWMPEIPNPVPRERGYHLCRRQDLVKWLGPTIWEAKPGNIIIEDIDKVVTNRARLVRRVDTWNATTQRLFAADCAEQVLHLFEDRQPGDDRPRETIRTARLFALGEASNAALFAASSATLSTASSATLSAAWYAIWSTARSAASAAAWCAAKYAASDAASAAARYAVSDLASDAASVAAWYAAWDAARDATWDGLTDLLFDWLEGRRTTEQVRDGL